MKYHALLFLIPAIHAFQLPFQLQKFFTASNIAAQVEQPLIPFTPRIAIIGAGAAGSSAAFWISKAKERFGVDVDIDVYESNAYIGGRSTTVYPYNNKSLPELELGASIFVEANKNLWRASDEFNLTRRKFEDQDYATGIWDGQELLLSFSGSWWDTAKLLWRYGFLSPRRAETFVRNMIDRFLVFYSPDTPKWDSITTLASTLGWTALTNQTTAEYLIAQGVSEKYTNEVVEAATRVNYGQNVDYIHALEGACAMAGTGASGIVGGNFQVFEKFLNYSGANVHLNTSVSSILPSSSSSQLWSVKSGRGIVHYQAVIVAAPFQSTGITFPLTISDQVSEVPYVHLHVTLLTTSSPFPNPAYFGLQPNSEIPRMMLTTYQGARAGGRKPEFNSLSYHGEVGNGEWVVKIFSEEEISDEWLTNMFQGQVGWVLRKTWDAYPKLPPTSSFPPIKLDRGLYYVNSFEPFISTMETETISSRNVVDLMLNDEFNAGICGRRIAASGTDDQEIAASPSTEEFDKKDFVFGWDC
ncbi:hypothetical protein CVT25_006360 [Psilocybe cyanescens]|uniref:Prenylcysteine lyase domain-containing protein n=1 Tax=Psilocybe cyanescens TaxID=93625 RepID=A0A409VZZ2_PSICY|nr:hypothetical protein CVT25_006360 [Psilocybe cyanescens]